MTPTTGITFDGIMIPTPMYQADGINALRYIMHAHPGEPLFVIRGRDMLAVNTLGFYGDSAAHIPGMYEQVARHRLRFEEWKRDNLPLMKFPDPYPGWQR